MVSETISQPRPMKWIRAPCSCPSDGITLSCAIQGSSHQRQMAMQLLSHQDWGRETEGEAGSTGIGSTLQVIKEMSLGKCKLEPESSQMLQHTCERTISQRNTEKERMSRLQCGLEPLTAWRGEGMGPGRDDPISALDVSLDCIRYHVGTFPNSNPWKDRSYSSQGVSRAAVKSESEVTESCPTLSDPMDCSTSGSSVHGIFQARVLEWGAITFSSVVFTHGLIIPRQQKMLLSVVLNAL
ncbi:hypothetical protein MG293_000015 [Ovis ammon polii]|uniref:Uncharacterized protein n=1 Tax=Ovis ammon polii TaxID=230172 RepID=A0AAD4UPW6_OVIAM|nr:hypothetical protein MG293_000015 [Ovis ammon polii]